MKKLIYIFCLITLVSCTEQQKKEIPVEPQSETTPENDIPRVTGIGGIFFFSEDPKNLNQWYGDNLGLALDGFGSPFEFRNANNPDEINFLRWAPFADSTNYFQPSTKEFMINYRVNNIEALVKNLKDNGVLVVDDIESYPYGKFVHIMDPEGNKIELWEPIDSYFYEGGTPTTK